MFWIIGSYAQTKLEVDGSIQIGNHTDPNPNIGTLRWSGSDFEVWNGVIWASLTGNKEVDTVEDIDGNIYKTIRIGNQVWMTENLRVSRYRGGAMIDSIGPGQDHIWEVLESGAWCWYDTTGSGYPGYDREIFGKLYNWYVVGGDSICPEGWHVPSDVEMKILTDYLGGFQIAGGKMKETGTDFWQHPNVGATNESGFTGFPGGLRRDNGIFIKIGLGGYWWSSTESNSINAYYIWISNDDDFASRDAGFGLKNQGHSVRCVRD